jgi:hypothetical protein
VNGKETSCMIWICFDGLKLGSNGILVRTRQYFVSFSQSFRICSPDKARKSIQELLFNIRIFFWKFSLRNEELLTVQTLQERAIIYNVSTYNAVKSISWLYFTEHFQNKQNGCSGKTNNKWWVCFVKFSLMCRHKTPIFWMTYVVSHVLWTLKEHKTSAL